jgi:hypothetical protein
MIKAKKKHARRAWATSSTLMTVPGFAATRSIPFEGWLNNLIARATLQALRVWDRRQMRLVDRRMTVGGRDLLYKLEQGYHGRALNANGPNTHYRDICVVDVVGPDFACDAMDPQRKIEGTPLEKGFVYDQEIWVKLIELSRTLRSW